jgi:hypothetical protein
MGQKSTGVGAGFLRGKTGEAVELLGFFLIVLLPAILSNFGVNASPGAEHDKLYSQVGFLKELLGSLRFGLVAAFFLARHGESKWSDAASTEIPWPKQVLAGVGLWFAYYLFFDFWALVAALANIRLPSIAWLHPTSDAEVWLNGVFSFVNGHSEEIMRVYLLTQTQRLGLKRHAAAFAVALMIASYHVYQGAFTVVAFVLVNAVLNRLYLSKRPLVMLIVWHILSDFMHPTDMIGWEVVSAAVNGALGMGLYAVGHAVGLFH